MAPMSFLGSLEHKQRETKTPNNNWNHLPPKKLQHHPGPWFAVALCTLGLVELFLLNICLHLHYIPYCFQGEFQPCLSKKKSGSYLNWEYTSPQWIICLRKTQKYSQVISNLAPFLTPSQRSRKCFSVIEHRWFITPSIFNRNPKYYQIMHVRQKTNRIFRLDWQTCIKIEGMWISTLVIQEMSDVVRHVFCSSVMYFYVFLLFKYTSFFISLGLTLFQSYFPNCDEIFQERLVFMTLNIPNFVCWCFANWAIFHLVQLKLILPHTGMSTHWSFIQISHQASHLSHKHTSSQEWNLFKPTPSFESIACFVAHIPGLSHHLLDSTTKTWTKINFCVFQIRFWDMVSA